MSKNHLNLGFAEEEDLKKNNMRDEGERDKEQKQTESLNTQKEIRADWRHLGKNTQLNSI